MRHATPLRHRRHLLQLLAVEVLELVDHWHRLNLSGELKHLLLQLREQRNVNLYGVHLMIELLDRCRVHKYLRYLS